MLAFQDESEAYANRLRDAGVAITYRTFPGRFHGFFTMGKLRDQANVRGPRHRSLTTCAELSTATHDL